MLFVYGRFPVWPVFEGGWKNTQRDRLEVFSLDPTFRASSLHFPPPPPPFPTYSICLSRGDTFLCEGLKKFFRLLHYNKIKKLRGDSFSQLIRLRVL